MGTHQHRSPRIRCFPVKSRLMPPWPPTTPLPATTSPWPSIATIRRTPSAMMARLDGAAEARQSTPRPLWPPARSIISSAPSPTAREPSGVRRRPDRVVSERRRWSPRWTSISTCPPSRTATTGWAARMYTRGQQREHRLQRGPALRPRADPGGNRRQSRRRTRQPRTADPVDPPVPDHLWTFTTQAESEAPSGTTFTDSIGGEVATLRGNGGSLTGGAVVLPGTTTGNQPAASISAYIDLPNGIVSATAERQLRGMGHAAFVEKLAAAFRLRPLRHHPRHRRGHRRDPRHRRPPRETTAAYDNLSLTFNNAGNINSQQLEGQYDGNPPQFSFTTATTTAGTKYHYVLVVEDGRPTRLPGPLVSQRRAPELRRISPSTSTTWRT